MTTVIEQLVPGVDVQFVQLDPKTTRGYDQSTWLDGTVVGEPLAGGMSPRLTHVPIHDGKRLRFVLIRDVRVVTR